MDDTVHEDGLSSALDGAKRLLAGLDPSAYSLYDVVAARRARLALVESLLLVLALRVLALLVRALARVVAALAQFVHVRAARLELFKRLVLLRVARVSNP